MPAQPVPSEVRPVRRAGPDRSASAQFRPAEPGIETARTIEATPGIEAARTIEATRSVEADATSGPSTRAATTPEAEPAAGPEPANRAARRGRRVDAATEVPHGRSGARRSGPAHPGAQGRRVNPIRRTG